MVAFAVLGDQSRNLALAVAVAAVCSFGEAGSGVLRYP